MGRSTFRPWRAVCAGEVSYAGAVQLIEEAEAQLRALVDGFDVEVDRAAINAFMVRAHLEHWNG